MWICPTCNREFKRTNESHFCETSWKTIDAYIEHQPLEVQPYLNQIKDTLRQVLPNVQERLSWGMPTFWDKHNIIHFSSHKKHIGIYPGSEAIEHFADRLTEYKTTKGAIQFPYRKELPLAFIAEIAAWCHDRVLKD